MLQFRRCTMHWMAPLIMGVATCLASGLAHAQRATVTLHDGRTLDGELIDQTPQTITLEISGIQTPIAMTDVASVSRSQSLDDIYRQRKADLDPNDSDAGYALAYFLLENKMYDAAKFELSQLEKQFPGLEKIKALQRVIDQKIKLIATPKGVAPAVLPGKIKPKATPHDRSDLLTSEQVNLIRLWELPADLLAAKPRVTISKEVIRDFFVAYRDHDRVPRGKTEQRDFLAKKGYEQLNLLFQMRARDFYKDVTVRDDPQALTGFRRLINPAYVVRYFRRHFGTGQVPGFYLIGSNPNGVLEAYTNFYILSETNIEGAQMINRSEPDKSLLLQWGLPREDASFPAPDVPGWRPFFTAGRDDPKFTEYVQWINGLYDPKPNYSIQFTAPLPPAPQ